MAPRDLLVTLDCSDPVPLAQFWAAMLDGEIVATTAQAVVVRTAWIGVAAMASPGYRPPTWPDDEVPKQVHLDLAVDDLDAAYEQAVALGARPAAVQPAPDARRIMLDPAGHPFCLTTGVPRAWLAARRPDGPDPVDART